MGGRAARPAPPPLPGYNTPHKRVTLTVATLLAAVCLTLIFLGSFVDLAGGGSLAAVSTAALASGLWARGSAPEREVLSAVKLRFGGWWDAVVLPALFCMLGSSIDAQAVFAAAFLADYAPGLVAGVATRFLAAFACAAAVPSLAAATAGGASEDAQPRRRWSVAEAVWCAASCIGKASVQAALGGAALVVALDHQADARAAAIAAGNVTAAQLGALTEASGNVERAQGVASLASLAAVVFAPISAALMRALGPPLLGSAKPAEVDKR
uniref:Uncharacterized protein n=1 Tax=Neobodo designis TaxID=312471 RepID=A0A7S1MGF0_NEODS